jgi:hypothetical protein
MTAGHLREHFTLVDPGHTLLVYQNLETKQFGFFGEDTYVTVETGKIPISELCFTHYDYEHIRDFPISVYDISKYSFFFMINRFDQGTIQIESTEFYKPEIIVVTDIRVNHTNSFTNTLLFSKPPGENISSIQLFLHPPLYSDKDGLDQHDDLKRYLKTILSPVCGSVGM